MFKWNFQYFNVHCKESVTSFCTPFHQIFVFIDKIPWALLSPGCLPSLPWGMLLALGQLFHQCLCCFFFIPYAKLLFSQSAYSTHWCMGLLLIGAGLCISSYRFFWGIPQLISPPVEVFLNDSTSTWWSILYSCVLSVHLLRTYPVPSFRSLMKVLKQ